MNIKPMSSNCIILNQDGKNYEVMIVDGLMRVKDLRNYPKDDKVIFREGNI